MDKKQAKLLGLSRFRGEPCKRGHDSARYTSNGACIECMRAEKKYAPVPEGRQLAVKMGAKKYKTDKPCKNGHVGIRYLSTGSCVQCQADAYAKNSVKFSATGTEAEIAVLRQIWEAILQGRKVQK